MNIKPSIREVRVVLSSLGFQHEHIQYHYNDTRVRGGRIKFYTSQNIDHLTTKLENRLGVLFPGYVIDVTRYGRNLYTVHFKDEDGRLNYGTLSF